MEEAVKRTLVPGSRARAYGGSTAAALLRAAAGATAEGQRPHSLHAHFLAPADPYAPTEVNSRLLRSSRSFTTLAVDLVQGAVVVAAGTVSFYRGRDSPAHAATAPTPWHLPSEAPPASGGPIPREDAPSRRDFDLRMADPSPVTGPDGRPVLRYWVRCREPIGSAVDQAVALTWVSDLCLTRVADLEHESSPGVRVAASLDHALWFHRPYGLEGWLLYETTSPAYADGLAFSSGRFFADGALVASVAQQSMLRRVIAQ